jgi:S-adenosylmethionine synthetase
VGVKNETNFIGKLFSILSRRKIMKHVALLISVACLLLFVACGQGEKVEKANVSEPEKTTEMAKMQTEKTEEMMKEMTGENSEMVAKMSNEEAEKTVEMKEGETKETSEEMVNKKME